MLACVVVGLGAACWARGRGVTTEHDEFPAVRPSRAMARDRRRRRGAGRRPLGGADPGGPGHAACTTRTPPGTTCPSRRGSPRPASRTAPLHRPASSTAWFYPQNSELLHAVGIVALDSDFLSPLINLGWLALALLAAWCIGRPYAVGPATLLGAAVVLDSEMIVGSQAGNAPNDIVGLFFLLALLAFLVNGAATARAAPECRGGRAASRGGADAGTASRLRPGRPTSIPRSGVVTEVPVTGDPRVLAGSARGRSSWPALRRASASAPRSPCWPRSACLRSGSRPRRASALVARAGDLARWHAGHRGFWYGRNLIHAAQPLSPDRERRCPAAAARSRQPL